MTVESPAPSGISLEDKDALIFQNDEEPQNRTPWGSIVSDVRTAADSAYDHDVEYQAYLADRFNDPNRATDRQDEPFLRHCANVSMFLAINLIEKGYTAETVIGHAVGEMNYHTIVYLKKGELRAIADPTWKQFIGVDDLNIYGLPDVLIMRAYPDRLEIPESIPQVLKVIYEKIFNTRILSMNQNIGVWRYNQPIADSEKD